MSGSNQPSQSTSHLADRLTAIRRGRFVGREAELDLFRSALLAAEPPFAVLHVYGLGGVGKSTLLREYARLAAEAGRPVILLDRDVEPSPPGFGLALRRALGLEESSVDLPLAHWPSNGVLLIDTYELLAPLDGWLRETCLPQLPADSLVVIAGRNLPASVWRTDIAWAELTRFLPLRNLRPEESQTYLAVRGIPEEQHANVLAFTHGHPLALSLVAEVMNQGDKLSIFNPQTNPDVVRVLLERFTRNVPDLQHRRALEICAHVRVTNEALLTEILGAEAHDLFQWLRQRSFIEQGPHGLFPHDLAREVLDADWHWRNPEAYQTTHHQIRRYYERALKQGDIRSSLSADVIYLLRYYAAVNPYFDWDIISQAYMEPATPEDYPFILEMLQQYEGANSVKIARYWLQQQPEAFTVFRTAQDRQLGYVVVLMLPAISEADVKADPALAVAQTFMQQHGGPLRPNEILNFVRFWAGRETYQTADIQSLVAMNSSVTWISNPHMAWTFAATADPQHWQPMFTRFNFDYTGAADYIVGGHRYGVFTHNWRTEPVAAWLDWVGAQYFSLGINTEKALDISPPPLLTLSQPEFAEAVRQALRDYTRPDMLVTNPLLRSRLVAEAAESPAPTALQTLLQEAVETLTGNPKDQKLYRAIHHTYLEPAPTQEQAAELLDLPFNTYRYHLANGLKRITAWLWQRELH
ncbi:MAG TPA: AAA family ATPase [Anaerolineae bacterium]